MKTNETSTPQMDEIVFEKRNKLYGAYFLRKMYNKQVIKATLLSVAILIAGLAYPLVLSYNANGGGINVWDDSGVVVITNDPPPPDVLVPPPPEPLTEPQKQIAFKAPDVVIGEVPDDGGFLPMDELNKISKNIFIDVNPETTMEKQPDIIVVPEEKKEIFIIAEEMPFYPGGDVERMRFLAANIQYPQQASELGIQGTVYLQFVVDSQGNITDVKIMRGIGGGCEEEALRVVKMMPQWHPGKQNGKAVRVLYTMPVSFKLQG
jgi:protein TonB